MPLFWKPPGVQAMPEGGGSHRGSRVFFNHHRLLKNSAKRRVSSVSLRHRSNCSGSSSVLENCPPMFSLCLDLYYIYIYTHTHVWQNILRDLPREFQWQTRFFGFFVLKKNLFSFSATQKQWLTEIKILIFVPLLLLLSGTICEGICGACCQWCDVDPWQSKQFEIEELWVVVLLPVATAQRELKRPQPFPLVHIQTWQIWFFLYMCIHVCECECVCVSKIGKRP